MNTLQVEIPYPPTVNTYYRTWKGRTLISNRGRDYRAEVVHLLTGTPQLSGSLSMRLRAVMPDWRRRDLDNILKAILDSLQHAGLYRDDSQIDRLEIERGGVESPGRVFVTLEEIE